MTVVAVGAQDITYWGYAQESTCTYRIGQRFGSEAEQGVAVKMSKAKAALLKGKRIVGLRALFSTSSNVSNVKFFVTSELGGTPLAEASASSIRPRFTEYKFSSPIEISGETDLYFGFTLNYSSSNLSIFSTDQTNALPDGLVWGYTDGKWQTVSCNGAPAIYLMIEGSPDYADVTVKPVDMAGFYAAGKTYDFSGQIFNSGTQTINEMDVTFTLGDNTPVVTRLSGLNIEPRTVYDFTVPACSLLTSGTLPMSISADNIVSATGAGDSDSSDNLSTLSKYIYPATTKRRILLDYFTGLDCPNCPLGTSTIASFTEGREDDFVIVAHHTYGGTLGKDYFTMKEDDSYKWFFNGSQYAPALMANRVPYDESLTSAMVQGNAEAYVRAAILVAETHQPYVEIGLATDYDADTRLLTATVTVTPRELPPYSTNRLNVYLKQSGVVSGTQYVQSGASSSYVHNNIFRGSLTDTWGEDIELKTDETITRTYTYTVPEAIVSTYSDPADWALPVVLDNMSVVAFVEGVTSSPTDCPVYNAVEAPFIDASSSINAVTSNQNGNEIDAIYNAAGQMVAKGQSTKGLASGMYIVRSNGKTKKIFIR